MVLQPGQVSQRQQQLVSQQVGHHPQVQQVCQAQESSSVHPVGSESLGVNHPDQLTFHLKQLHEQQQQQAYIQQPQVILRFFCISIFRFLFVQSRVL